MTSITTQLTTFLAEARTAPLSDAIIEKAKHHIVDTVAAMISGTALHVGERAMLALDAFSGRPEATVFGQPGRYPAYWAAMFNAMLAHADETDDSHEHSKTHPGCGIVPTALAMAQREKKGGMDVLRAVCAGYDFGPRMVEALGAMSLNHAGTSTHAFGALFGSGACASVLAGFDLVHARRLLSYLAHESSGLACWMAEHDHVQKAYVFGGMGAKNAITTTVLVQSGWTGLDDAMQGPRALFEARGKPGPGRSLDIPLSLGEEILGSNIKKWCVGSPAQAPLDCIEALLPQLPGPDEIQSITVEIRTDEAFIVDNRDMPNICLQHLLGLYLVDRSLSFDSVHDVSRIDDPRVRAVRSRVKLIASDALLKAGGRQAIVEIVTTSGQVIRKHVEHVRGTWGDPMPREEVDDKARDLLVPIIGEAGCARLLEGLWNLEHLDAGQLDRLIANAVKPAGAGSAKAAVAH
ncbi:MAG: MmgE/PrpD family protein [Pseudomonadota bacterium]